MFDSKHLFFWKYLQIPIMHRERLIKFQQTSLKHFRKSTIAVLLDMLKQNN